MEVLLRGRFAGGLLERSQAYLNAFQKQDCKANPELVFPSYYLLALSCELALKAYLAATGWSEERIKVRLSHRLERCLKEAVKEKLPEVNHLGELIADLSEMNEGDFLRYPKPYVLDSAPEPGECATVIKELIGRVRPTVTRSLLRSLGAEAAAKRAASDNCR